MFFANSHYEPYYWLIMRIKLHLLFIMSSYINVKRY